MYKKMNNKFFEFLGFEIQKVKVSFLQNSNWQKERKYWQKLIFNKSPCGEKSFKHFTGSANDDKFLSLLILLPKISGYVKRSDWTYYMSFVIGD